MAQAQTQGYPSKPIRFVVPFTPGSASHVSAEKLRAAAGFDAAHAPLQGAPEVVAEILSGRAHFGFLPITAGVGAVRDGRLAPLAVSTARRSPVLPHVPTIAEADLPAAQFDFWIGLLAPARRPPDIVARVNAEIAGILAEPELKERLARLGVEPLPLQPERFDAHIQEEYRTLGKVMKDAGVKAN